MLRYFLMTLFLVNVLYGADITGTWDANSESDLAGYKIYYGTQTGNYTLSVDVGNATSITIPIQDTNKTYFFAITAYDIAGNESGFSQEVSLFIPPPADTQAPTSPKNVTVVLGE